MAVHLTPFVASIKQGPHFTTRKEQGLNVTDSKLRCSMSKTTKVQGLKYAFCQHISKRNKKIDEEDYMISHDLHKCKDSINAYISQHY